MCYFSSVVGCGSAPKAGGAITQPPESFPCLAHPTEKSRMLTLDCVRDVMAADVAGLAGSAFERIGKIELPRVTGE